MNRSTVDQLSVSAGTEANGGQAFVRPINPGVVNVNPLLHLKKVMKDYPAMSSWAKVMLQDKGKANAPDWPNWCFLPMGGWAAMIDVSSVIAGGFEHLFDSSKGIGVLAALGTWRYSQGIYRFDPDLLSALTATELSGDLPCELFQRLPEWCVYVETPGLSWLESPLHGFWAHMEWDVNHQRKELRFVLNTEDGLIAQPLHLGKWSVETAISKTMDFAGENDISSGLSELFGLDLPLDNILAVELKPLIAILLYLCSEEPEIDPLRMPQASPTKTVFKKGKKGPYLFTPDKPRVLRVGDKAGRLLRIAAQDQDSGRTVKSHLRRGHWHGFWTGPRSGQRRFVYHWIAPLVVEGRKNDDAAD
ncbi:hypothetical protein N1078_18430 [Pseudomonas sp. MIL19]|uniref:AcrVA2 family anti-CRISPR protein n=1 Tax=Pseudomonas sp. MIL19 TaxID=2976979 RepID=UPI002364A617|nr:hypothetical protein [Pseudomonas sp. MIL19]MDD2162540.1 hypothetical protein [Pseudomonas sp. MIL19]